MPLAANARLKNEEPDEGDLIRVEPDEDLEYRSSVQLSFRIDHDVEVYRRLYRKQTSAMPKARAAIGRITGVKIE